MDYGLVVYALHASLTLSWKGKNPNEEKVKIIEVSIDGFDRGE